MDPPAWCPVADLSTGRGGRPRIGSPKLGQRIRRLLRQPKAWTIPRLWQQLGRPAISLRTLHRRVREVASRRRPRLVARGDPDRDQILAGLQQAIAELPDGAVVLAEDEAHINLLPWVRATWIPRGTRQQVMTPGAPRSSSGGLPPTPGSKCCTARATAPRQPGRADLGRAQGVAGQQPDPDHPRPCPPGARLLPPAQPRADADHRRAAQLTVAARGLRAELQGGRLAAAGGGACAARPPNTNPG